MGTAINKDVPPFLMVSGSPARPHGLNSEGLKRRGFDADRVSKLRKAYKLLYRSGLALAEAVEEIRALDPESLELQMMTGFLESHRRGIVR
jgi:UDP-N-acetylglucosamine acyltransferase